MFNNISFYAITQTQEYIDKLAQQEASPYLYTFIALAAIVIVLLAFAIITKKAIKLIITIIVILLTISGGSFAKYQDMLNNYNKNLPSGCDVSGVDC